MHKLTIKHDTHHTPTRVLRVLLSTAPIPYFHRTLKKKKRKIANKHATRCPSITQIIHKLIPQEQSHRPTKQHRRTSLHLALSLVRILHTTRHGYHRHTSVTRKQYSLGTVLQRFSFGEMYIHFFFETGLFFYPSAFFLRVLIFSHSKTPPRTTMRR